MAHIGGPPPGRWVGPPGKPHRGQGAAPTSCPPVDLPVSGAYRVVQALNTGIMGGRLEPEEVHYRLMRLIEERPELTQRQVAQELGVSLGKVNYCLQALVGKGHVKFANFRRNPNKRYYTYLLTRAGIEAKADMTLEFLRRKMTEYDRLKREIDALTAEAAKASPHAR